MLRLVRTKVDQWTLKTLSPKPRSLDQWTLTQRSQYPLNREYTLNDRGLNIMV